MRTSVLKRILCPIDFDEHSGRALARAQDLALRHGAELRLLHVLPSRPESILMPSAWRRGAGRRGRAAPSSTSWRRRSASAACGARSRPLTATRLSRSCRRRATARRTSSSWPPTAGRECRGWCWAPSPRPYCTRRPCPLLTIPPRAAGAGGSFRRVLCAVDFSPSSPATLSHALAMVEDAYGELTVLNVIDRAFASGPRPPRAARRGRAGRPPPAGPRPLVRGARRRAHRRDGGGGLEAGRGGGSTPDRRGRPFPASGMAAMVGSCADRIVRESPCPVLAVPSPVRALRSAVRHPAYA